jgi:hypothetical protein
MFVARMPFSTPRLREKPSRGIRRRSQGLIDPADEIYANSPTAFS